MARRNRSREELIAEVVAAWNEMDRRALPDLMAEQPRLYFAVSWLAAHDTVKARARRG